MSFVVKKEVCPACHGEKVIECCSCGEEESQCTTMSCPYCQGNGFIKEYNMPIVIGMMCAALVAVLAVFLMV